MHPHLNLSQYYCADFLLLNVPVWWSIPLGLPLCVSQVLPAHWLRWASLAITPIGFLPALLIPPTRAPGETPPQPHVAPRWGSPNIRRIRTKMLLLTQRVAGGTVPRYLQSAIRASNHVWDLCSARSGLPPSPTLYGGSSMSHSWLSLGSPRSQL